MLKTLVENRRTGKGTCVQLVDMPICAQCVENVYEVVLTVVRLLIQITCIISCIPDKRIEQFTTSLVMNMKACSTPPGHVCFWTSKEEARFFLTFQ